MSEENDTLKLARAVVGATNDEYSNVDLPLAQQIASETIRLTEDVTNLWKAADKLTQKMSEVTNSKEWRSVWVFVQTHGLPYTGDNWKKEYNDLCFLLSAMKGDTDET